MSFDQFEKGMKVEAIADFQVREVMASPVGSSVRSISVGDSGEVREKRSVGPATWLIVYFDSVKRQINVDQTNIDNIKPA
ncbi:hypothetical protein GBAR_LOCUS13654 [Geodia barretti]|uniref:Uncharacterized protein n=1 Tax=Geodia barretti TaxID=519541 RepID=A0AA35S713_GEOBA|nr:hypothetical protein GBAR_LOCUS13654 [Geodia barretti]